MRLIRQFLVVLCLVGVTGGIAGAQTINWVTDEWRINLRSGAGSEFRILQVLETGDSVEVVERGDGWTRVRVGDGTVGWVPSQYLMNRPAAASRLESMAESLEETRERTGTLEIQLEQARSALEVTQSEIESLAAERTRLSQQLDAARDGLELSEENNRLKKEAIDLQRRIQDLESETSRLADRSRQDWFVVGAGVLFAGMLVGIIVTRIRWRRRSSWGQL